MARVKFSPIVTNIAGSVGGVTFQRNKFGNTMREKPLPLNPATSGQYNIRQLIRTIQQAWQNLTDAQRLQWDRFPDFSGQTIKHNKAIKISGHALYIKYQLMRLMCGLSLLTTINYDVIPELPLFSKVNEAAGSLYVYWDGIVDSTKYFFLFSCSSPRSPSRRFSRGGIRFMKVTYGSNTYFELTDSYVAAFGVVPSIGDTIHVLFQWYSVISPVYSGVSSHVVEIKA